MRRVSWRCRDDCASPPSERATPQRRIEAPRISVHERLPKPSNQTAGRSSPRPASTVLTPPSPPLPSRTLLIRSPSSAYHSISQRHQTNRRPLTSAASNHSPPPLIRRQLLHQVERSPNLEAKDRSKVLPLEEQLRSQTRRELSAGGQSVRAYRKKDESAYLDCWRERSAGCWEDRVD